MGMLLDMAAEGFGDRVVIGRAGDGLTAPRLRELAAGGARLTRAADADAIVYLGVNGRSTTASATRSPTRCAPTTRASDAPAVLICTSARAPSSVHSHPGRLPHR